MKIQHIEKVAEDRYKITSPTCSCGSVKMLEISGYSLFLANQGELVQKVLPDQSNEVREQFVSGICGTCWNALFADIDEEDEE